MKHAKMMETAWEKCLYEKKGICLGFKDPSHSIPVLPTILLCC